MSVGTGIEFAREQFGEPLPQSFDPLVRQNTLKHQETVPMKTLNVILSD